MRFAFAHWDKAVQEREGGARRDETHPTWRRGPRRFSAPVSVPRASASRQSARSTSIVAGVDETCGVIRASCNAEPGDRRWLSTLSPATL